MLIDCQTCVARDLACDDCVISVLLASPPNRSAPPAAVDGVELDEPSQAAITTLAAAGLVPPLRLVRAV